MTFRRPGRPVRISRRSRVILAVAAAIFVIVVLFLVFTGIWTDLLWFRSVHFTRVFTTVLATRVTLFVVGGVAMAVLVGVNMVIAYRTRPVYRPLSVEQQGLERYRAVLDPHRRAVLLVITGLLGLVTGSSTAGLWRTWLLFINQTPFGIRDAQFHRDISFFTFTYPFVRAVLGFLFTAVVLAAVAAAITHYLYGGVRLQSPGERVSPAARAHLSVLVGLFVLLKAVAYWFDRYGLAFSQRQFVKGPSFTDVNAVLPAKAILTVIALLCAVLFFVNVFRRGLALAGVSFGLLVLSAILVGGVYPAVIQRFQVSPNELDKESRYIARTIAATRQAFGVQGAQVIPYSANVKLSPEQLASEAATIPGVRLLDPRIVSTTFQQLQQVRGFYQFPDSLDIDRYALDGTPRDTVVAVRELNQPPEGQRNWINSHLVYTHGFGFVAASGTQVQPSGDPSFVESDIPPTGRLGEFQPRVYFGENSPDYSIVGGPAGTPPRELDFPNESQSGQQNTTYTGRGGVPIGSFIDRFLYAVQFREKNILLSGAINRDSRILYIREPRDRVEKVAPFLTVDGDPYPAVVNGRIVWIMDCYTTSDGYPYSERVSLADATADTTTQTRAVTQQPQDHINYIRNSVKATVDAYDGTVTLYAWDDKDPVLRTWMRAFPGIVKPKSAISPELMQHVRYPEDLFKVQRQILARYHVQQPQAFYGGQDFWHVPDDPTQKSGVLQPPYYLTLKMPDDPTPQFSLTTTFVPRSRPNLAAFMSVDSVPGSNYGRIRILELPRDTAIPGPGQVQNTFESNTQVSTALTPLRLGGSKTVSGNLLTLPFGGGLLYVEPIYVQAAGSSTESYPLLRKVLVSYGNDIGFGNTLSEALNQIFQGTPGQPPPTGGTPQPPRSNTQLDQAIREAQRAYQDGVDALKRGDFRAYGDAQQRLKEALDRAAKAAGQPVPTPQPTATAGASPPTG